MFGTSLTPVPLTPLLALWLAAAIIVSYFIGAVNPASIIAKARGIDLRAAGSGNLGATNAGRILGKRTGIFVGVFDVLKGFVPVMVFGSLVSPSFGLLAGFAAIIGHMTSPFLGGKGGKGVATTMGVLLAAEPIWLIVVLVVFAIVYLIVKRIGLASVAGAVGLIVVALIDRNSELDTLFGVLIGLLVIARHQRNIRAALVDFRSSRQGSA